MKSSAVITAVEYGTDSEYQFSAHFLVLVYMDVRLLALY